MKIPELREKIRSREKEELQTLIVEMYKLIPKSVKDEKEIDALIDQPTQFKAKKKALKTIDTPVDFPALKKEIEQFLTHAYAQNYIAPNRLIPKKERSTWRFIAKRFIDQITVAASNPDYEKDCASLLEKLYILFCHASSHYIFVSEEPFYTLNIPQEEFLKRVIILKKQVDSSNQWIRETLQLILEQDLDPLTLTNTLLEMLLEQLPNVQTKKEAIAICEQMIDEQAQKIIEPAQKKPYAPNQNYAIEKNINTLVEMMFILHSTLGEKEQAVQYFEQHAIQSSSEIKLYVLLRKIKGYQTIQDWLNTYEQAIEAGIKPRENLQQEYLYVKKHGKFSMWY